MYARDMSVREKLFQIIKNPIGSLEERGRLARLLMREMPVFVVNSGNWAKFPSLSLRAANVFPEQLLSILQIQDTPSLDFDKIFPITQKSKALGALFDKNGSDKTSHGYERIYSKFFETLEKKEVIEILEIGIGTNSPSLISSMGRKGRPGASLFAFAEFDSRTSIIGADIDRKILFNTNQIKCFFVDQTNLETYYSLLLQSGMNQFDFIIDDGLHSTEANLNSLIFAQNHLAPGGYLIIEDIPDKSLPLWNVVIGVMRARGHEVSVTRATRCNVVIFRNSF
jgi:hypothetical protein